MTAERPDTRQRRSGSEYDAVTFEVHWPGLSWVAFALTLPLDYGRLWIWPDRTVYIATGLTAAGLIAGWIGCIDRRRRRWAAVAALVNGMVLVALWAIEWIYSTT